MVDRSDHPNNILSLFVYNKFIYILQLMQKTVPEDDDMADDLKYLLDLLLKNVQDLSTFDEYAGELLNGRLEWTPVHKSEKFWRENAQRLCEKNHELILVLINTINNSTDSIALAVACHDLGEFVRFYSRGKLILQEYGIIEKIMTLLYHTDPNTKYEALISLQKIMIHNWDFLGKQLSSGENSSKNEVSSS
uniref:V-type proton ATPase subunit H (Trinotate prediction) n=1 Tax=Henneguya salminicola TaxID=69463 RepID=A0A6G3MEE7_HENSL